MFQHGDRVKHAILGCSGKVDDVVEVEGQETRYRVVMSEGGWEWCRESHLRSLADNDRSKTSKQETAIRSAINTLKIVSKTMTPLHLTDQVNLYSRIQHEICKLEEALSGG
jgi:hypothetical protein